MIKKRQVSAAVYIAFVHAQRLYPYLEKIAVFKILIAIDNRHPSSMVYTDACKISMGRTCSFRIAFAYFIFIFRLSSV